MKQFGGRIVLFLTVLLHCAISVFGNYECICNYAVESAVFGRPDNSTVPLGLLYEFDCKALDRTLSTYDWWAILFYHQIGYVRTTSKLMEQACTGSVPLQDRITTTQGPSTTITTNTSTILYGKSTTKQTSSHGIANGTYQTQRKTTALLPTLQGNISAKHPSSLWTRVIPNRRTTMAYTITSSNTSSLHSTDSYENIAKTRQPTSHLLRTSMTNISEKYTYSPSNKTGLTLLFSKVLAINKTSTVDPIQRITRLINITRRITSRHTVQNHNFTVIYNLSLNNTSPKNVYTSTMSYGTKKNSNSSENVYNYTYASRMTMGVNLTSSHLPRNTTIGSFVVTDVKATPIHPSRNNVTSINPPGNVTTGRCNITSIIPAPTSLLSNKTIRSVTFTVNNVTINYVNRNVTVGAYNSTPNVPKSAVILTDNITRASNMLTYNRPQYTSKPSESLNFNYTRTFDAISLQNITTLILPQNTSAYSYTSTPAYQFNKTTVNNISVIPTGMYTIAPSQNKTATKSSIQNIFTTLSFHGNITREPVVSNHTTFSHSQTWNKINTTTDISYNTRLSTMRDKVNSTTTDAFTTTTDVGIGKETSDTFVSSYGRETTFSASETIKQHSFILSEITSPRPHTLSNTNAQNEKTTSAQSLQATTTDKWTVELCPYYMLSKTSFNGALDHPYPLVRTDGGYCYELNIHNDNWFDARSECKEKGGDLVVIESKRVITTLLTMLRELNITGELWIGLTNLNEDGQWHWVNANHTDGFKFENWDKASYSDPVISLRRNCATLDGRTGKWRTRACQTYLFYPSKYHFICQYEIS